MVELFLYLQQQNRSGTYLKSLLQRFIEPAISNFDLPRYASYIETRSSRAFKGSLRNSRGQGEKETQSIPGGPIKALYEYVSAHKQETPSRLLQKIQTQASELTVEQSKEFLMSFLEEIMTVVDVSSVGAQRCIQSLVTSYITQTVGKEPKKPSDWARPEEVKPICYRKCADCPKMNTFLRDPELQHHILSCEEPWHLKFKYNYFRYLEVDEVDRTPVAVTKTLKWWEEQHRKWESRASDALEALQKLPQAELKQCLTHRYDEIMDLRAVKVIDDSDESKNQGHYETRSTVPQERLRDDL